jgi:hypothetical protein
VESPVSIFRVEESALWGAASGSLSVAHALRYLPYVSHCLSRAALISTPKMEAAGYCETLVSARLHGVTCHLGLNAASGIVCGAVGGRCLSNADANCKGNYVMMKFHYFT